MRYLLTIVFSFILLNCSSSNDNDDDKDFTREFSAQIDEENFIPDSVEATLYYYNWGAISPKWRVYIDTFNDSDFIRITLENFTTDGQTIPEATFNLNALTNSASFSHGYNNDGAYIGLSECFEGSLTVTGCDSETQTISGEFSFRANYPFSSSNDTITVSNGIFRNIPYIIINNKI